MAYYNKTEPKVDDIVFVTINNCSSAGTYCNLIEYNSSEGFILNTELDRWSRDDKRQVRIADQKKFKYDQIYCARVLTVNKKDETLVSIDLSYKKIPIDVREQLVDNFGYITRIKQLCDELVFFSGLPIETVYDLTIRQIIFDTKSAKEIYHDFLKAPEVFVEHLFKDFPEHAINFVSNMKSRTIYTKMTVEQPFDLVIYDTDAITKLQKILEYKLDDTAVECVSSPKYKIITSCYTLAECNDNITACFELLKSRAVEYKAIISLKPRKNTDGKVDDAGIIKQQEVSIKRLNMQINQNQLNQPNQLNQ